MRRFIAISMLVMSVLVSAWPQHAPGNDAALPKVSPKVAERGLIKHPRPAYPPLAKQARIEGTIVLRVNISAEGKVVKMTAVSGHPILLPAALDAVRQWEYRPFMINGKASAVQTTVQVNFSVKDTDPQDQPLRK